MNIEIRRLEENIVNCVNSSNVPTEVKRLVVFEVLSKLEAKVNQEMTLELHELNNKMKEKESEET